MENQEKNIRIAQLLDQSLKNIQNAVGYPLNITRQVNEQYRLLERQVNQLALASGMSDDVYNKIVVRLTRKAAGTEIQVLQMMRDIFISLGNTVNFQDPINVEAIFGGIDRVNENIGGKGLQSWLKEQLVPMIQKTRDAGLNPKQLTSLISNAVSGEIGADTNVKYLNSKNKQEVPFYDIIKMSDGKIIDKNTGDDILIQKTMVDTGKNQADLLNMEKSYLLNKSQTPEEYLGWKGNALRDTMEYGQGLRNTLTPITLRPDDQQRIQALTEREFTGLDEAKLRLLLGIEQGMAPGTLLGIENARNTLDETADIAPSAAQALNVIPQTTTYVSTGAGVIPEILDPSRLLSGQPASKAAKSKKKLIKLAQINNEYTYTTDPNNPTPQDPFNPQPISGVMGWQQDVAQADITGSAASRARELELKSILGQKLGGDIMTAEKESERISQLVDQFQAGLGPVQDLKRSGVTDENIIKQIKPLMIQLMNQYNNLSSLYVSGIDEIRSQLSMAGRGDSFMMSGQISILRGFEADLKAKIQDVLNKQKQLVVDSETVEQRMKQKLQEAVVSDTLQQASDLYESAFGSTIARGGLAASQAQEAKYLDQAADQAASIGSGISSAMQARLRQKALEKMRQSLGNLDASAQSPISSTSDRIQMLGP